MTQDEPDLDELIEELGNKAGALSDAVAEAQREAKKAEAAKPESAPEPRIAASLEEDLAKPRQRLQRIAKSVE